MKFKDLAIGEKFVFALEKNFPYSGAARGPWKKTGSRTYSHSEKGTAHRVGSINAKVMRANPSSRVYTVYAKRRNSGRFWNPVATTRPLKTKAAALRIAALARKTWPVLTKIKRAASSRKL